MYNSHANNERTFSMHPCEEALRELTNQYGLAPVLIELSGIFAEEAMDHEEDLNATSITTAPLSARNRRTAVLRDIETLLEKTAIILGELDGTLQVAPPNPHDQ